MLRICNDQEKLQATKNGWKRMVKKCWAPADIQNRGFMAKNHYHTTSNAAHQNRVKNANAIYGQLLRPTNS